MGSELPENHRYECHNQELGSLPHATGYILSTNPVQTGMEWWGRVVGRS